MKNCLRLTFTVLFIAVGIHEADAKNYSTISNGNWKNSSNWSSNIDPGTFWVLGDTVFIQHNINLDENIGFAGVLIVEQSGTLSGSSRDISAYQSASLTISNKLEVKSLSIGSQVKATFNDEVEINGDLTIGQNAIIDFLKEVDIKGKLQVNGGNVHFYDETSINSHFENNDGTVIFDDDIEIKGHFTSNHSNAHVTSNKKLDIGGQLTHNSGAKLTTKQSSITEVSGQLNMNSNAQLKNYGKITISNHGENNGGSIDNYGQITFEKKLTQSNGSINNDGVILVHQKLTVNAGGIIDGNGLLRMNDMSVYGTLNGNDICNLNESNTPQIKGNGTISSTTTYCQQSLSATLPIELDYFKVEEGFDKQIEFSWRTLTEVNNDKFEVEFSSDGKSFMSIINVKGSGSSNLPIQYNEIYKMNESPNGYYRLKQTDFDGTFSYSKTKYLEVEYKKPKVATVYPNPNDGRSLFVELQNLKANEYVIDLLNNLGVLIVSRTIMIEENAMYFETELLHGKLLNHGIYYIRISSSEDRHLEKVIVE